MAVALGLDQHVSREGGEPRGYLPDVQVVDVHDTGVGGYGVADLLWVEPFRSGLHEDPPGVPHQPIAGPEHEGRDHKCGEGVHAVVASSEVDDGSSYGGGDEGEEVGED